MRCALKVGRSCCSSARLSHSRCQLPRDEHQATIGKRVGRALPSTTREARTIVLIMI